MKAHYMTDLNVHHDLLTVEETSQLLRISKRNLFDHTLPRGRLPSVRIGRRVLYRRVDVMNFIDDQRRARAE